MAMTAALYTIFFFLSYSIALPNFTLLYLPIILLGVLPLWFGVSGLVGSMIGAFIGGVFVEGLPLHFAWAEAVTAFIIYALNWILIPKTVTETQTKKNLFILIGIYAGTLFAGTSYILWQLTFFQVIPAEIAEAFLLPTFGLNIVIEAITCPVLIRTLTPRLKNWGIYSGNFREWLKSRQLKPQK